MAKLTVADLMTDKVYSLHADEDLARLNDLMSDINIRHVPVVGSEGELLGIVSQRDLLRSALDNVGVLPDSQQRDLLKETLVREIMVSDPETADAKQPIEEAGRVMLENKMGCLPVTEGGRLIGILTEADFIKYIIEHPVS